MFVCLLLLTLLLAGWLAGWLVGWLVGLSCFLSYSCSLLLTYLICCLMFCFELASPLFLRPFVSLSVHLPVCPVVCLSVCSPVSGKVKWLHRKIGLERGRHEVGRPPTTIRHIPTTLLTTYRPLFPVQRVHYCRLSHLDHRVLHQVMITCHRGRDLHVHINGPIVFAFLLPFFALTQKRLRSSDKKE